MACNRKIDIVIERKAYIKLLLMNNYSYRIISSFTKTSISSIARIKKTLDIKESSKLEGTSTKSRKTEEIKSSPGKTARANRKTATNRRRNLLFQKANAAMQFKRR